MTSGWSTLGRIRRMAFESAVDLEFFARFSAAFCFLTGARRRVGFHTFFSEGPYRGDLMTHRLLYNPYLHTSQIFTLMVEALRADPAQLADLRRRSPRRRRGTRRVPARAGGSRNGARDPPTRNRGPVPMRAVDPAQRQRQRPPAAAPLGARTLRRTRAPSPRRPAGRLCRDDRRTGGSRGGRTLGGGHRRERCFSLAGKTSLRQLLVLYTLAEVLVTNDSGPAHFASLTPINVVTLFGPETPRLFAARTPRNVALWSGVACSPCVNAYNNRQSPCRNNVCMQRITVDQVFAAACEAYRQRPAAGNSIPPPRADRMDARPPPRISERIGRAGRPPRRVKSRSRRRSCFC